MDAPDAFARSSAMAANAVLKHLLAVLEDKGVLATDEVLVVLGDAQLEFDHPQATEFEILASALVQQQVDAFLQSGA